MRNRTPRKQKLLRAVLILALCLTALAVAAGIATAVKYNACEKSGKGAVIEKTAELSASKDVVIGQNVQATALVRVPWGRTIVGFDVTPGKNAQLAGTPSYVRRSIGWGYSLWQLNAAVHAYRPGEIPEGRMVLLLEGGAEKKQELSMILPAFQAKTLPVSDQDELVTAGKITPPDGKKWNPLTVAILVLALLLIVLIWILFRNKDRKADAVPPWMLALKTIGSIRGDLHSGKADAARAIISLTDVIRGYLELRFHLRAEHQTTREFLDELHTGGPLDSKQSVFLKEFLNSADMVKFAKAPADVMAFDEAADRAETLVRETSVSPEKMNAKEGKK